jgi:hypothetical protein
MYIFAIVKSVNTEEIVGGNLITNILKFYTYVHTCTYSQEPWIMASQDFSSMNVCDLAQ